MEHNFLGYAPLEALEEGGVELDNPIFYFRFKKKK